MAPTINKSIFDIIHFLWQLGPYIFVTYILVDSFVCILFPSEFGTSDNPISIRWAEYAHHIPDVPHVWKHIYTSCLYLEFYVIFSDYISSSVGLVTITMTCGSNKDKKSIKIPEEATMYCKSKKDAANKVKNICYIHCHILIIIPYLNTS